MSKQAPTLKQLQLAAKDCAQIILKRQPTSLETAIESALLACENFTKLDPQFALLLLNNNEQKQNSLENTIIKLLLTTSLFGTRLNVLPKTIKTVNRACLYLLYCTISSLQKLQRKQITVQQYRMQKKRFCHHAFTLAYKLKIEDKEVIKLLSQLAKANKFHQTNQVLQVLTLLSFNTNLAIGFPIHKALTFEQALNSQLTLPPSWLVIEDPLLNNHLQLMQKVSDETLFSGNLLHCPNLGYFVAISQSPDLESWYCLPYQTNNKEFNHEVVKVAHYQITKVLPQVKLNIEQLWQCYQQAKAEWPLEDDYFSNTSYYDPVTLKYSVPEFWPKTTKALLTGNIKQLSQAIDSRAEFKNILLGYATNANRNKLEVTSSKHAITLLGLERVFPVITSGMMKLVEENYRFTGSDELNNKVSYLADISLKLAESKIKHSLPEYQALIVRLLALSLFTIPKVAFSASSQNKRVLKPVFDRGNHICLAEIYQYPRIDLWLKVALHMIEVWKLPKVLKQFITKYLTSQRSNLVTSYSAMELEWLELIEQTNLVFLLTFEQPLDKGLQQKLAHSARKYGMTLKQLQQQAQRIALELNVKTSLC